MILLQEMAELKWNVTPLLCDFGGRVGFRIFLQSSTIQWRLPSLTFSLIALSSRKQVILADVYLYDKYLTNNSLIS